MKPVIEFDQVIKSYGSVAALSDVSLTVEPGRVFALLGENGAGKTTSIRIMLGYEPADAGRVRVLGLDSLTEGEEIRRRVGYMPDEPSYYPWMTVDEIGWFTAGFYGNGFRDEYRRLVDDFGLPRKRKIKALSKGMRAKVGLALAMAHEPELLILDEPTSGLDTMVRREFLESMVDWAARGRTVLLSSHQIGEVERVADQVAMIRRGHLVLVESLEQLKATTLELKITMTEAAVAPPTAPGEVLRRRRRARQWQVLLRDADEAAIARLEAEENVLAVERRAPALEEIFVAYMQEDMQSGAPDLDEQFVMNS